MCAEQGRNECIGYLQSPEILYSCGHMDNAPKAQKADGLLLVGRQQPQIRNRQVFAAPPWSAEVACTHRGSSGTREIRCCPGSKSAGKRCAGKRKHLVLVVVLLRPSESL